MMMTNTVQNKVNVGGRKVVSSYAPLSEAARGHSKLLVENYANFKVSGEPDRFMYYEDGSWVDFPEEVLGFARSRFAEGRPVFEAELKGSKFLFDLYRMLQIDLGMGSCRSVAWIDVKGKCFFPKVFLGYESYDENLVNSEETDDNYENLECEIANLEVSVDGEVKELGELEIEVNPEIEFPKVEENAYSGNPKIKIEIKIGHKLSSGKRKRDCEGFEARKLVKEEPELSSASSKLCKRPDFGKELLSTKWPKVRMLREEDKGYGFVRKMFMCGLGVLLNGARITAIHQWTRNGPLGEARFEIFNKQVEITKKARGEANMVLAWLGASSKAVESILTHGFGLPNGVPAGAHGIGVHLSPIRSPHPSLTLSEADENGEKHVIMCRVILGKSEKVEAGSQQMFPSSMDYDTGVDNTKFPKCYVVWCSHMNTHILPECIVSYRPAVPMLGKGNSSSSTKLVPGPPNHLTAKFISKLKSLLSPKKVRALEVLCSSYKNLDKDVFMQQLRSVAGDDLLRSTFREILSNN